MEAPYIPVCEGPGDAGNFEEYDEEEIENTEDEVYQKEFESFWGTFWNRMIDAMELSIPVNFINWSARWPSWTLRSSHPMFVGFFGSVWMAFLENFYIWPFRTSVWPSQTSIWPSRTSIRPYRWVIYRKLGCTLWCSDCPRGPSRTYIIYGIHGLLTDLLRFLYMAF